MRLPALLLLLIVSALQACVAPGRSDARQERPNILFVIVDDQRADVLGCAGHPVLQTPNIDRLAAEGVRFSNSFVTTSICAASRATILTGLVERSHGYTFFTPPLTPALQESSYPSLLGGAGYRTAYFGKFGVRLEDAGPANLFDVTGVRGMPYWRGAGEERWHIDERNTEEAIEFLRSMDGEEPFCLTVGYSSGHAQDGNLKDHFPPIRATSEAYAEVPMPRPRLGQSVFESQPAFLRDSRHRDRWFWRWDTPEKYDRNMRDYLRMLTGVDHMVGQMVETLEEQGLAENTVVIFCADNGYYMGERGFAGKWSHYEESLRVPLVIFDPRVPVEQRGRVAEELVLNTDWTATLLDLAGVPVPEHYQGRSLLPFTRGEQPDDWRTEFFCEHLMADARIPRWEGVRQERWKYARYIDQDPVYEFLFDLDSDPDELVNLAGEKSAAAELELLREATTQYARRYEAAASRVR